MVAIKNSKQSHQSHALYHPPITLDFILELKDLGRVAACCQSQDLLR